MNSVRDDGDSDDGGRPHVKYRLLDGAVALPKWGLHVFPLSPGTKGPSLGLRGIPRRTTDIDQIGEWWTASPDGNVGVRTEGLAVVERLGHSSIAITLDTYSHVTATLHADAAEQVASLLIPTDSHAQKTRNSNLGHLDGTSGHLGQ